MWITVTTPLTQSVTNNLQGISVELQHAHKVDQPEHRLSMRDNRHRPTVQRKLSPDDVVCNHTKLWLFLQIPMQDPLGNLIKKVIEPANRNNIKIIIYRNNLNTSMLFFAVTDFVRAVRVLQNSRISNVLVNL